MLPAVTNGGSCQRVDWKLPVYNTVHHIITNPVYAGAYVFGRTGNRVTIENGRKLITRGHRKEREDWDVLIIDHHEGYISWAEYERNQKLIADNTNGKSLMGRGSIRRGEALLAGLLRCGHCGRKLHVAYSGKGGNTGRYHCQGGFINHGGERCISFGGMRIDRELAVEVIDRLCPLGVEAAIAAMEAYSIKADEKRQQMGYALEQAQYEMAHARRQYDAVDPDNRLVAGELERRWNERLAAVHALQIDCDAQAETKALVVLSDADRARLLALGQDLERAWNSPGVTASTRKRIIRTLIHEIIVRVEDNMIYLTIHWHGGDHTSLTVKKNRTGQHRWSTDADVVDLVRALARQMPDKAIAAILNRSGKKRVAAMVGLNRASAACATTRK